MGHVWSRRPRGISLIELMVTLTIVAVLTVLALPKLGTWVADSRVRTAAQALQDALRMARVESLKRSRIGMLALTNAAPVLNAAPVANGTRWFVQLAARPSDSADELKDLYVTGGTEVATERITLKGPALICFNALGQLTPVGSTATGLSVACDTNDLPKEYQLSSSVGSKTLKVQVALGGQVRICDAGKSLSDDTPDGC